MDLLHRDQVSHRPEHANGHTTQQRRNNASPAEAGSGVGRTAVVGYFAMR
jgi:hypothetical protein